MVTQKADVLIFALALLSAYLSKLRVSAGKKQLLSHPLGLGCGRNRGPKGASINKVTHDDDDDDGLVLTDFSCRSDAHSHLTEGFVGFLKIFFACFSSHPVLNGSRHFEL